MGVGGAEHKLWEQHHQSVWLFEVGLIKGGASPGSVALEREWTGSHRSLGGFPV